MNHEQHPDIYSIFVNSIPGDMSVTHDDFKFVCNSVPFEKQLRKKLDHIIMY